MSRPSLPELFRLQARYCRILGSPLYAHLLEEAASDFERGGPTVRVLAPSERDAPNTMLSLRFMGAVHRAVLKGQAPELAELYPSVGGQVDLARVWPAFSETLERIGESIRGDIGPPVQTNEVARSAALLGGFLVVAESTGLPLRVLEIGASAGLNLNFDHYFYETDARDWGDSGSPVRMLGIIQGDSFPWSAGVNVAERRGCDAAPLDPASDRDRLLLRSFVWPDQIERFALLTRALDFARTNPVEVEQADAGEWAARQLARPGEGRATVVFHSIVMMYLSDESRESLVATIEEAGQRATPSAPLAWLRMELGGDEADVRLTLWPRGEERLIAKAGYQGQAVRWLGG